MLQNQLAQARAQKKSKVVKREPSPIQIPDEWTTGEVIDLT